ncbi:cytochrome P450 [Lasiosphaeria hispida]|uniref:Cytochrome P450 n=1 Tax=Lasiosphaeria hispida TaxID=260671 RepID=A0AAJ0H4U8_9PEZI|nr:cytochrome P450 [Lasiosphaeria hispida]
METLLWLAASVAGTVSLIPNNNAWSLPAFKTFLAIFCTVFALRKAYWLWVYPYWVSPLRRLPGPTDHHFLIGQILNQFLSGNPNEPYLSWMRKWPDADMIRYFTFGNSEAILVTGLDVCREILSAKTYSFVKPAVHEKLLRPIVGKGLLFTEGEEHKAQRRLMAGPFSLTKLKSLIPVFQQKSQQLSDYFDRQIASQNGIVELSSTYSSLTLDIIGVAALGADLQNLDAPTPFHECYHRVFEPPLLGQALLVINAYIPVRWIPVKENRQFKSANSEVQRLTREIVRQRIKDVTGREGGGAVGNTNRRDLLTYIVEETYATDHPWSEDEILGHMLNMIAAGHETTASALLWATYALVKFPDVQQRLRSEILALLEEAPIPSYSEIERPKYLDSFCKEVLRVWCPAISTPREAAEDVVIKGVHVPKGTTLMLMPAVIHLNPRIWGEDAHIFNPDRWERKPLDPHAFAPFIQGPRQCIGRVFSMLEFKAVLIEMVAKFCFEAVDGTDNIVLVNPSPLLRPKGGFHVRVRRY